jgi:hypothetical protein
MNEESRTKRLAMLTARNKRSRASERRMAKANSDTITIGEAARRVVEELRERRESE